MKELPGGKHNATKEDHIVSVIKTGAASVLQCSSLVGK